MKKLLILVLTAALLLIGCTNTVTTTTTAAAETTAATAAVAEEKAVTITDTAGRQVTLEKPAERIVALAAADCEILYELGVGDKLVGRGEYCDYPEAVLALPAVQSGSETNMEQVLALEPDLVILDAMYHNEEHIKALENAGIAVLINGAATLEQVYEAILMEGKAAGVGDEAEACVIKMRGRLKTMADRASLSGEGKKTVYFEVSPLEYGLWTAGADTFMNEIADILGMENIFADVSGWAEVSQEQVIAKDPDYIFTIAMSYGNGPKPEEEILGRSGWENIKAIKEKTVYTIDSNSISRPGPRLADAAEELYNILYGD